MTDDTPSSRGQTAAAKLLVCKWIHTQVETWEAEAKAELRDMLPGDHSAGMLGGQVIGGVVMRPGNKRFKVVDEGLLADWVAKRWSAGVEHVTRVRPDFQKTMKDRAVKDGALVDDDGEVCPWVEVHQGEPFLMTKPDFGVIGAIIQELLHKGYTLDGIIRELPQRTTIEIES
jgi:hypothetical protein